MRGRNRPIRYGPNGAPPADAAHALTELLPAKRAHGVQQGGRAARLLVPGQPCYACWR